MTRQEMFDAINKTAKNQGLELWIPIEYETFVPMALNNLAALLWYRQAPEDNYTKLIREQLNHLWGRDGRLVFDD